MPDKLIDKTETKNLGYSPIIEILLNERGISTGEDASVFLKPSFERDFHDPFLMHDMENACVRIFEAIEAKEKIVVYADYDCDGIPGAVILSDFFKKINYENFKVYIPDRHTEGYGLKKEAIDEFIGDEVKLLITIDLGISNKDEVAHAKIGGIETIVTDHHVIPDDLPPAYAIVHPKLGNYPYESLCGSGVVFKLIQGLIKKYGEYFKIPAGYEKWFLDMAGLATLSDMVPLTGENRAMAYFGLKVWRKSVRPGVLALLNKLAIDLRNLTEDDLTFMVTPRINAASRMDSPMRAFELLSTINRDEAINLADHLSKINDERKTEVALIMREVHKTLESREIPELVVIGNPKWRVGVLGIVATKIAEHYEKTAFVWGMEGSNVIKGSCRSDGKINVSILMKEAKPDTFIDYGGHELAGGFSVSHDQIHFLEESLLSTYSKALRAVKDESLLRHRLPLSEVNMLTYDEIAQFAPFGLGNPKPVFLFENVEIISVKLFGKEKNHLEIIVGSENSSPVKAIAFFSTENSFSKNAIKGAFVDLIASFDLSFFGGRKELRLRIVDIN